MKMRNGKIGSCVYRMKNYCISDFYICFRQFDYEELQIINIVVDNVLNCKEKEKCLKELSTK